MRVKGIRCFCSCFFFFFEGPNHSLFGLFFFWKSIKPKCVVYPIHFQCFQQKTRVFLLVHSLMGRSKEPNEAGACMKHHLPRLCPIVLVFDQAPINLFAPKLSSLRYTISQVISTNVFSGLFVARSHFSGLCGTIAFDVA